MKKYQIVRINNFYVITTKEAIQDFYKTHFLPYDKGMKHKSDLINLIETSENFLKYKNNTTYKTIVL